MKLLNRDKLLFRLGYCFDQLAVNGADRLVDFTMSFPLTNNPKALWKRVHRFFSNIVQRTGGVINGVAVLSRTATNHYHVHCCFAVDFNVAAGFNWTAFDQYRALQPHHINNPVNNRLLVEARRSYQQSMTLKLRQLTARFNRAAKQHQFGRCWLLPVRKNVEALKHYYYSNVPMNRRENEAGLSFIRYWGVVAPPSASTFSCFNVKSVERRQRYQRFGQRLGLPLRFNNDTALTQLLGVKWKWQYRRFIHQPVERWSAAMQQHLDCLQPTVQQYCNRMDSALTL